MKTIIFWLLIMLLGGGGMAPMAIGDGADLFHKYTPINDKPIQIETDPPPNLVVNDENPWTSKVFEVEDVWPGNSDGVTLKLQNIGDPGILQLHLLNLVDEPGTTPEPEPTPDLGEFSQNLDMQIWWDANSNGVYEPPGEALIVEDTLDNVAGNIYGLGTLRHLEIKYLGIAWSVDNSVGNEIMGDRCTFDIQFLLN